MNDDADIWLVSAICFVSASKVGLIGRMNIFECFGLSVLVERMVLAMWLLNVSMLIVCSLSLL